MKKPRIKSVKKNCGRHCRAVINALKRQESLLEKIIMNQQELLTALNAANAKVQKIIGEIQALKTALENTSHEIPQDIADAANQLFGNIGIADDLNPDAPAPAPEPTPEPEPVSASEQESAPTEEPAQQ